MAWVSLGFHRSAGTDGAGTYALLLSLVPFFHCSASAASALAFSFAFLPAATSAFFALPAAFLLFSPAAFLPAIFTVVVRFQSSIVRELVGLRYCRVSKFRVAKRSECRMIDCCYVTR